MEDGGWRMEDRGLPVRGSGPEHEVVLPEVPGVEEVGAEDSGDPGHVARLEERGHLSEGERKSISRVMNVQSTDLQCSIYWQGSCLT